MKLKAFLTRRRYLVKIASTCIIFLLVPCMVALGLFLGVARGQLESANEEYYHNTTSMFCAYFQSKLYDMRKLANQISLDSRENGNTAYALSRIQPEVNEYYYWNALQALRTLENTAQYPLGVYYYETGAVLYNSCKYTVEGVCDFLYKDAASGAELSAFFREAAESNVGYFSDGKTLLVSMPVRLGAARLDALIFYILDASALDVAQFAAAGAYNAQFSIYAPDSRLLLSSAGANATLLENVADGARIRRIERAGQSQTAFLLENGGLYFAAIVPLDAMQQSLYTFYSSMQLALLLAIFSVVLLGIAMVYVNYRPIQKMADHFPADDGSTDELGGIVRYVERIQSEMNERNLALMDPLLGNMLSGAPIPSREMERLGLPEKGWYCVTCVRGGALRWAERAALAEGVRERFAAKMYITDIVGSGETVMISLLPAADGQGFSAFVRDWLEANVPGTLSVRTGPVVPSANEIRRSYEACADPAAQHKNTGENVLALRDAVLEFIESNYANPELCQVMVADHFGLSTYSLSRLFKNHVGAGFSEYVNARRIRAAKSLLCEGDKSVAEIASLVGIANANYFSRLFKAETGLPPLKFREEHGRAGKG